MQNLILEQNLEHLPVYLQPILVEMDLESAAINIVEGREGWPVAVLKIGNKTVHTNSLNNPWKAAERWAETLNYNDMRVSFIYGCGFGYPLLEYAKRKKLYTETIIFEQNTALFYAMLCSIDIRPLLKDPTCHFMVGNSQQIMALMVPLLTGDFLLRCTKLTAFFTWLSHRNEKEQYLQLHELIWQRLELMFSSVGNSIHDTLAGLYNTLDNVESMMRSPQLSSFREAYAGKPAFIVANGPSLDKNIHELAQAVGKSLILTAESALRPCLKRDIQPDAICVTERSPNVYHFHFEDEALPPELALIGLTLIDPRIPRSIKGPWIPVFRSLEHSGKWVQTAIGGDIAGLQGGSSSAHLAFEFALWTGASPIIFVGQDLAFGPDKLTHSKLSVYSEKRLAAQVESLHNQPTYIVPGVDGNPVMTTKLWCGFKTWFEQHINLHPNKRFIDATEGGAYIQGTELMTLKEAVETFCIEPLHPTLYAFAKNLEVKDFANRLQVAYTDLIQGIQPIRDQLNRLAAAADEDLQSCRLIEKALFFHEKYPGTEFPAFIEALARNSGNIYQKYTDEAVATFVQHLIFAYQKQINDIGEIHSMERLGKLTNLHHCMIQSLKKTCQLIAQHFDRVVETLQRRAASIDKVK